MRTFRTASFVFAAALLAAAMAAAPGRADAQPHMPRSGPNLVENPSVSGVDGWSPDGEAYYDDAVSRSGGSGSLRIDLPYPDAGVSSSLIPVEPGRTYTFAVYIRVAEWPAIASIFVGAYDASGSWVVNLPGSRQLTTGPDLWQESVILVTPQSGHAFVGLRVVKDDAPRPAASVWVDDFYFGEGVGFEQPPSPKQALDGTATRVDELGNFEVLRDGAWVPFFPFCICTDGYRDDWSVYAEAGFNCDTWASANSSIVKGQEAGLMSSLQLGQYLSYSGWAYRDFADLAAWIESIQAEGLTSSVLMYYFDNESYQDYDESNPLDMWDAAKEGLETVDATERAVNGGERLWPRYMLMGNEGMARAYSGLVDIVGDYIGGSETGGADGGPGGLEILDNVEGQTATLMGQINPPQTAGSMRVSLYRMVIGGGKGWSFWRDIAPDSPDREAYEVYGVVPIEETDWFAVLPVIRDEIEQLLPVIREPHWTAWSVTADDTSIALGTRDHDAEGYLILANRQEAPVTSTLTLEGLPYEAASVLDYFTGAGVATLTGSSFTVTLEGQATAVYRLVNPAGPDSEPPTVPTDLEALAVSSTEIDLSWTASTDDVAVTGYRIYRDGDPAGTSTGTTYSDTGLSPLTTYTYEVSAYDAAGHESARSLPASATTLDVDAPVDGPGDAVSDDAGPADGGEEEGGAGGSSGCGCAVAS
jgi:hypothetical protein